MGRRGGYQPLLPGRLCSEDNMQPFYHHPLTCCLLSWGLSCALSLVCGAERKSVKSTILTTLWSSNTTHPPLVSATVRPAALAEEVLAACGFFRGLLCPRSLQSLQNSHSLQPSPEFELITCAEETGFKSITQLRAYTREVPCDTVENF
jgi:hypothetical protein